MGLENTPIEGSAGAQLIAIALVEHQGRFLVGRRPPHVPLAGYDEFPGGRIQSGETPLSAAARECREETGLEVTPVGCYRVVRYRYPHASVELHFIACRPKGELLLEPAPPFAWVSRDELANCCFPPANRGVLEDLLHGDDPFRSPPS